jgi:hypothetical protein
MRRLLAPLLLLLLAAPAQARELVLVVRADSPVIEMDSLTVRKLFLGFSVVANARPLHAVRQDGDDHLDRAFLQAVVGMSEDQYERRLLSMAIKQGRAPPQPVHSTAEMLLVLHEDALAVGCLWADQLVGNADVRIVRLLWRD